MDTGQRPQSRCRRADGLVSVHPAEAVSDGEQSLKPQRFAELMIEVSRVAAAVGRTI
jgi:3-deoxy-7-phosphoheptulonate synthase